MTGLERSGRVRISIRKGSGMAGNVSETGPPPRKCKLASSTWIRVFQEAAQISRCSACSGSRSLEA